MSGSGTTTSNTQYLVLRKSYALNDKDVPIDSDKILITGINGIIDYVSSGVILSNWSERPAVSDVNMNGHSIYNAASLAVGSISATMIDAFEMSMSSINQDTSDFYFGGAISSVLYGPDVSPSLNPDTFNFSSSVAAITLAPSSINVGGGIGLGGRLLFGVGEPVQFARISGVAAGPIEGDFVIETLTQTSGSTASLVERMRIKNSGFVGIGTNNPTTALDVIGDITCGTLYYSSLVQTASPAPVPLSPLPYQIIDISGTFNIENYYNVYSVITNSYITSPVAPVIFNINGYSVVPENGTYIHILNNSSQTVNMLINMSAFVLQDKKFISAIFHNGSWVLHNPA